MAVNRRRTLVQQRPHNVDIPALDSLDEGSDARRICRTSAPTKRSGLKIRTFELEVDGFVEDGEDSVEVAVRARLPERGDHLNGL